MLWERAGRAANTSGNWAAALGYADRAREFHLDRGQARAAARAQSIAGTALRMWGRLAEAREQLTAAVEVLRADPDADAVYAMRQLATVEMFASSPDADQLTIEALTLGQDLGVDTSELADLFVTRGIYLAMHSRRPQAIAYLGEAARLATQNGHTIALGRALFNLSQVQTAAADTVAAAEAARAAARHLRRAGARDYLAFAIGSLAQALVMLGDWDAERDLVRARLAAGDGDPAAAASFASAVGGLRELSTPYHLAHGLLDHASFLACLGDASTATAAVEEARDIASTLRCQPLLDRASGITPARIPNTG